MTTWNPTTYEQFLDLRARPFHDLVARLQPTDSPSIVDLGCGPGTMTTTLLDRFPDATVRGIDNSDDMLTAAAPLAGPRLTFEHGDLETFDEPGRHDIVLSNSALHWLDDHEAALARWVAALRPGGQLAVSLPANWAHPSHAVAYRVADDPWFEGRWLDGAPPASRGDHCLTPGRYAEVLDELGMVDQSVTLVVYPHRLPSSDSVLDFVRGTMLVPYRAALAPDDYAEFERRYAADLAAEIGGPTGVREPYLHAFERILMWGRTNW